MMAVWTRQAARLPHLPMFPAPVSHPKPQRFEREAHGFGLISQMAARYDEKHVTGVSVSRPILHARGSF